MCKDLRIASVRKLTLIAAAMLLLVFCAGVVCNAQNVISGKVTRGGVACPNARVVIAAGTTYLSAITDASGNYSISTSAIGVYKFVVNAIDAVPYVDDGFFIWGSVTQDVDLPLGVVPTYDDFSGTSFDTSKWDYYDAVSVAPGTYGDISDTSASILDISGNNAIEVSPHPTRGGTISKITFPLVGAFEFVLPKHYQSNVSTNYQSFAIVKDDNGNRSIVVDIQDMPYNENPRLYVFLDGSTTRSYRSGTTEVPVYSTRPKITVLKTLDSYDLFVNGVWKWGGKPNTTIDRDDEARVYFNASENQGTSSAVTPTKAYFDDIKAGTAAPVSSTTISAVKASGANGATVTNISDGIVTASFSDSFWVENQDRSAGMKIVSTSSPKVGQKLYISGQVVKANNEVSVVAQSISPIGTAKAPLPVGVTGKVAGELDKAGAAAQGLLVKVAGKVTSFDEDSTQSFVTGYYLDDGSGLAGDGNNKGLYVKFDETWKYPVSEISVGQFRTASGVLTVNTSGTTVVPAVRAFTAVEDSLPTFTAYNDFVVAPPVPDTIPPTPGDPTYNITTYNGHGVASGYLRDYGTGAYVPERVTITYGNISSGDLTMSGADPVGDTDIYFVDTVNSRRIVSLKGCIAADGTMGGWFVNMNFTQLDPNALYELVCTANRNELNDLATARYTLVGNISAENKSSAGTTTGTTNNPTGNYTQFNTAQNTSGLVARWRNIQPAADGTFSLRATSGTGYVYGYPFGAFRLRKQAGTETN
ncbi:MAG: hypothetical protein ABFD64_04085 [Armatimonadota bacterium]